jgi:hypothetical protein
MTISQTESVWKTMVIGDLLLKYRVREPAPDQWNAIGVVCRSSSGAPLTPGRRLVVGLGNTASGAMADMISSAILRVDALPASRRVIRQNATI